jgi:LDH2 family malate/lactate/ureidoglycolate dehydrogenase
LSCIVDILAGVLTGFGYGAPPGRPNFGHYVAAYNIAGFDDPEHFKTTMDEWLQMMKSTRPAPGHDRVLVAGQPEAEMEVIRRKEGIPLHPEVVQWIQDTCGELSVECRF